MSKKKTKSDLELEINLLKIEKEELQKNQAPCGWKDQMKRCDENRRELADLRVIKELAKIIIAKERVQ